MMGLNVSMSRKKDSDGRLRDTQSKKDGRSNSQSASYPAKQKDGQTDEQTTTG